MAVNKIASSKIAGKIDSAVKGLSNRILEGITSAMNRVRDVAGDVISAVNTAKGMIAGAAKLGETVQSIFEFDFTSLDWGSLIQILLAILGALFKKSCNRKIKRPKSKGWFPLIGSTECDNIEDAIKGTPYENVDDLYNEGTSTLNMATEQITQTDGKMSGSYIDQYFQGCNPYLMQVSTHLNGTRIINDATKGKEKRMITGPGGVSTFEDAFGDIHYNVPNNETKIIAKDKCETIKGNYCLTVEGDFYVKVMGNMHQEVAGSWSGHYSQGPQAESSGDSREPDTTGTGGATASVDTNVTQNRVSADVVSQSNTIAEEQATTALYRDVDQRNKRLEQNNHGGFYPVDKIPFAPGSDHWGRTAYGPQLAGALNDTTEQKSSERFEGDRDISVGGEYKHQAAKTSLAAIESLMLNSQNVKFEGNTVETIADGEIIQQANWITSFLNSGRFEFIALFNMTATSLTGQFSIVKGCIIDITTDLPFPAVAPPTQIRISVGQTKPSSMADILAGSQNSFHATFISAPTGVIAEFVPQGAIINQCNTGMGAYVVNAGYMAVGCSAGPCQIFGLPVLLN